MCVKLNQMSKWMKLYLEKYTEWENNRKYNCRNIPNEEINESITMTIRQMKNKQVYIRGNIWNELNLGKRWKLNNNKWGIEQNSLWN